MKPNKQSLTNPEARTPELAAREAEAILANARDAIISIDPKGIINQFNAAAEETFGFRADEVIGQNVKILMPSPYRDEHDGYISSYQSTGVAKAIGRIRDVRARKKNGEEFPIELSVAEVPVGDRVFYTAIIRDVTAFRAALEALQRERDFNERLIETTPNIILVLDRDAKVVSFNRYFEQLSGWSLAEVRGNNWFDVFIPERDREVIRAVFSQAAGGEGIRRNRNTIVTRGGDERLIEWYAEPLRDGQGKIVGVLSGGEDVTERTKAAEEMRRLEEVARERGRLADLGAIAAKIVHDLGNPLSGMSMQVQLLLRRLRDGESDSVKLAQPAERISGGIDRLNGLVRGFMDFAREKRLALAEVSLDDLVRELAGLWEPVGQRHGIEVELDLAAVPVVADADKMRRVIDNLIRNAMEALRESPGHVRVRSRAAEDGQRLEMTVEDDGPGIPRGVDVFRLFETTKESGTGIGLAVARQIVEAHGGTIDIGTSELGGACFTLSLPTVGPTPH